MPLLWSMALVFMNSPQNNAEVVGSGIVSVKITEKQCRGLRRRHCFLLVSYFSMPHSYAAALYLAKLPKNNARLLCGGIVFNKYIRKQCRACLRRHCFLLVSYFSMPHSSAAALYLAKLPKNNARFLCGGIVSLKISEKQCRNF